MLCYSNGGFSYRSVPQDYSPVSGEVIFANAPPPPTTEQLDAAFPGYAAALDSDNRMAAADVAFAAFKAAGCLVTCTGTPANSATYALDDDTRTNLAAIYSGVKGGDGLPGGQATFAYQDQNLAPHVFDATSIVNLAVALRNYYYLGSVAHATQAAGGNPTWPTQPVTIP